MLRRGDAHVEAGATHGDRERGTLKARRRPWIGREEVEQGAREKDGIGQRGAGGKEMGSWERWIGLSVPWRREGTMGTREEEDRAREREGDRLGFARALAVVRCWSL